MGKFYNLFRDEKVKLKELIVSPERDEFAKTFP